MWIIGVGRGGRDPLIVMHLVSLVLWKVWVSENLVAR